MEKYGLVLAGGGAKGAYQLGAWRAMREVGVEFSAVAGVSVGAINGALVASDAYDEAAELWNNASVEAGINISEELRDPDNLFSVKNFRVLLKEIIKNGGIDASPSKAFFERFIDERKVRESDVDYGLITFRLSDMSPVELFIKEIPEGELLDYILASSKVPGVSKIGPENETYLDGGVYDNAPADLLRKNGYNRLIVVDIAKRKGLRHKDDFSGAEIIYIRPYDIDDLGAPFDFDGKAREKRKKMGYLDAKRALGRLSGRRFYFEKDVFRELVVEFGADAAEQLERLAALLDLDKLTVYGKKDFLTELKRKCAEYQKELEIKIQENEQKFYGQILKRQPLMNFEKNEFADALAALDNIII